MRIKRTSNIKSKEKDKEQKYNEKGTTHVPYLQKQLPPHLQRTQPLIVLEVRYSTVQYYDQFDWLVCTEFIIETLV